MAEAGTAEERRAIPSDIKRVLDADCDTPCEERSRPFVLAATIIASAMAFIDTSVVHLALPALQADLGMEFDALQWVVNSYSLLLSALILTGGALGDRIGRRRVFVYGIVVFAIASILCAVAPTGTALIAGRALQGLGAALMVPQSLAIIAATFPKQVRGRAIGTWAGAAALTTAGGPIVGGLFIDAISWRAVFWINLPLAALSLWFAWRHIPENRAMSASGLDWPGTLLLVSAMASLAYGLTAMPERGFGDPVIWLAMAGGVVLLALFVLVEARAEKIGRSPLMPLSLFRSANFVAANAVTLLIYFGLGSILFLMPYTLIQIHDYSSLEAGLALLPFGLMLGLLSRRAGALADRFGARPILVMGASCVGLSALAFASADQWIGGAYLTGVLPGVLLLALGMTAVVAPLTTAVMNAAPDDLSGAASGVNNTASRFAGVLSVAVMGLIMLVLFSAELADRLGNLPLPQAALAAMQANSLQLAALAPPPDLAPALAERAAGAIEMAYRDAYRSALLVIAACSLLAALLSAVVLRGLDRK